MARPVTGRRSTRRRLVVVAGLAVLLGVVAVAGWLLVGALAARADLQQARTALVDARTSSLQQDFDAAGASLRSAQQLTRDAYDRTHDLVWSAVGSLPVLGDSVEAIAAGAEEADILANDVLPVLLDAAERVDPSGLRVDGATIDLAPIVDVAPSVDRAAGELDGVAERLLAADQGWVVGPVRTGIEAFQAEVADLRETVEAVQVATRLLPPMLGADGPRRYLLAFQNPAEARGTGGLMGAYGILQADGGRISVVEIGTDSDLRTPSALPEDLPDGFIELWGDDVLLWVNANVSADFANAGLLWTSAWEDVRGEQLDGVIGLDPVSLALVLEVIGPVTLPDGEQIDADNLLDTTLVEAYARYDGDVEGRKAYVVTVARAVVDALLASDASTRELVDALATAADERRLLVYAVSPTEQTDLERLGIAGRLSTDPGPYALATVNNAAGGKLDYYLDRTLTYSVTECDDGLGRQRGVIRVELVNGAPAQPPLPAYVRGADGVFTAEQVNWNRSIVTVYLADDATVRRVAVDATTVRPTTGIDGGRPVVLTTVDLPPGVPVVVEVEVDGPVSDRAPLVEVQPLVRDQVTVVAPDTCVPED